MLLLNVGGGRERSLPSNFHGWTQHLLDIDPDVDPDIVGDARELLALPAAQYDAVLCSHVLEHFHPHELPLVLAGFQHVLKADAFAHIVVPDIGTVIEAMAFRSHDITDTWYMSPAGPITFHDVFYGYHRELANGNSWYCHKTGFTKQSLTHALIAAKYATVMMGRDGINLHAMAFKTEQTLDTALASMQHNGGEKQ